MTGQVSEFAMQFRNDDCGTTPGCEILEDKRQHFSVIFGVAF